MIMHNDHKLSLVIPCHNEAQNLRELMASLHEIQATIDEVIFVDDGSSDNTWQVIKELSEHSSIHISALRFTKNFGKEAALEAGLEAARGDVVITLDADLEHPVNQIDDMMALWQSEEGLMIVNAVKLNRQKESWFKRLFTELYFKLFNLSAGVDLRNQTDFKLLDRQVVDQYLKLKEKNKFYRGLVHWSGHQSRDLPIELNQRPHNTSSWRMSLLFSYAKSSIISFSELPLRMITWFGTGLFIFSVIMAIDTLIKTARGESAEGFPTVILLILGIGSIIIISLGIIGEYLAVIYKELKSRPRYLTRESINHEQGDQ